MALRTDDCDIRDVRFYMDHGGNGDFYINLIEYDRELMQSKYVSMRVSMSGGFAPHEVRMAVSNLYRAMQGAGLNNHPRDDQ